MAEKLYFTYDEIHQMISEKMDQISNEFNPDLIIAIGGGGFISGRISRTFLKKPLLSVTVKLYNSEEEGTRDKEPTIIQWLDQKNIELIKDKRILIVDEVDDSRITLSFVVNKILEHGVSSIATFVIHNKITNKEGILPENVKHYRCQDINDRWIIYPWDAKDINEHNKMCKESKESFFDKFLRYLNVNQLDL